MTLAVAEALHPTKPNQRIASRDIGTMGTVSQMWSSNPGFCIKVIFFLFPHQTMLMDQHLTKIVKEVKGVSLRNTPLNSDLMIKGVSLRNTPLNSDLMIKGLA